MSAQEQIGKLQGLLARIKRNTGQPRVSAPVVTTAAATPAPAAAAADQSVDDLLDASPAPSPMPVEVDIALDSVPPAEAEPIPLVASSSAATPAAADSFGLDSEVSEVRVTTAMREPVEEVTVAAIEAEAEQASEELSEDDLVEVTDVTSIPPAASSDVDIDFDDEDEQPPASSQRSKVASTMDEALAAAAEQLEAEREVPLKTPPPESGPQAAPMPPIGAPAAPDVDALLGQELDIPTRAEQSPAAAGPTTEQLGQTIDLEEARGPSLELAEQRGTARPAPAAVEELEVALPGRDVVGSYDDNLQPPPEAREELEAHRRRQEDDIPPPPESLAQLPSLQPAAPELIPAQAAGPEVVARPLPVGSPEAFGSVRESFRPRNFVELLDASLALHGDCAMRLATLRDGSRDGRLVVVSRDGQRGIDASAAAPSLRAALDDWTRTLPSLQQLSAALERGSPAAFQLDLTQLAAPLPRAAEWVDGSAYLSHVRLVRQARKAAPPATLESDPLVYQGGASDMLGPRQPFGLVAEELGLDFEAELGVVLGDTPLGVRADTAGHYVQLLVCLNDWTYRNLVPDELAKGFGFFCSKPATGFAPFAVTPDELGDAWLGGRLDGTMCVSLDGKRVGAPQTGPDMHFSFFQLIEHVCKTRRFGAGSILGSGTISNDDPARGISCLQELRARETITYGAPQTPFLKVGSRVGIEFQLPSGETPFGSIEQEVVAA